MRRMSSVILQFIYRRQDLGDCILFRMFTVRLYILGFFNIFFKGFGTIRVLKVFIFQEGRLFLLMQLRVSRGLSLQRGEVGRRVRGEFVIWWLGVYRSCISLLQKRLFVVFRQVRWLRCSGIRQGFSRIGTIGFFLRQELKSDRSVFRRYYRFCTKFWFSISSIFWFWWMYFVMFFRTFLFGVKFRSCRQIFSFMWFVFRRLMSSWVYVAFTLL